MSARAPAFQDFVKVNLRATGLRSLDVPPVKGKEVQALLRASSARLVATTPMTWVV
jgi:hypothetical protein